MDKQIEHTRFPNHAARRSYTITGGDSAAQLMLQQVGWNLAFLARHRHSGRDSLEAAGFPTPDARTW